MEKLGQLSETEKVANLQPRHTAVMCRHLTHVPTDFALRKLNGICSGLFKNGPSQAT